MAVRHRKRRKPAAAGSDKAGIQGSTGCIAQARGDLAIPGERPLRGSGLVERALVPAEVDLRAEVAELREQLHAHLRARLRRNVRMPRDAPGVGLAPAQGGNDPCAGEQLHALEGRIQALEGRVAYQEEVARLRLGSLERSQEDQEARLRALAESVARLTTTASLAQIAQAAFALILSAIAAYLGRR